MVRIRQTVQTISAVGVRISGREAITSADAFIDEIASATFPELPQLHNRQYVVDFETLQLLSNRFSGGAELYQRKRLGITMRVERQPRSMKSPGVIFNYHPFGGDPVQLRFVFPIKEESPRPGA